jgi:hypothetical protein
MMSVRLVEEEEEEPELEEDRDIFKSGQWQ